jgi:hypothetical protein
MQKKLREVGNILVFAKSISNDEILSRCLKSPLIQMEKEKVFIQQKNVFHYFNFLLALYLIREKECKRS